MVGALVNLGVPEHTAKEYETRIQEGAILIAAPVRIQGDELEVRNILDLHGATQIQTVGDLETSIRSDKSASENYPPAYYSEVRGTKSSRKEDLVDAEEMSVIDEEKDI